MKTLHLLLAESALELVPQALWSHPAVSKPARQRNKRPGETLLDDTFHHAAMKQAAKRNQMTDIERRGRPDIIHTTLLVALESRLCKQGRLQVWVHTRDDRLLRLRPDVRLQRAQHRFYGLMERLLVDGVVPQGAVADAALITATPGCSLADAVRQIGADRVVLFDEQGPDVEPGTALVDGLGPDGSTLAIVGGFPTGRLVSPLDGIDVQKVALGPEQITAWAVAMEAIVGFQARA